ncbi:MAG: epoxyqueuosine reductase QueH [Clostridia bacterium]|nr:epoxyqueuosine reductase QueH [Clostridia bacterium]
MDKINYDSEMKKVINELNGEKKNLLLHSCCAPCSSAVIERLKPYFDISVIYYNPNILPKEEYEKRKNEQKRLLKEWNIQFIESDYEPKKFACAIKGKEDMPEGSERCKECYRFRLEKTAQTAKEKGFNFFTTTLSISPHKNAGWVNEILIELENKYNVKCLPSDFKKGNGYLRSLELAKQHELYRQDYCGCRPK